MAANRCRTHVPRLLLLFLLHKDYAWVRAPLRRAPRRSVAVAATIKAPPCPKFCSECGSDRMRLRVPDGDERLRAVCEVCGVITYVNPKVVVACVLRTPDDRCLLAKRAIEPRLGTWGIPQGFMECGETSREAAAREAYEETGVTVDPAGLELLALYNLPDQVQIVYSGRLGDDPRLAKSTLESSEVRLFAADELPPPEALCWPTVSWALNARPVQQRTKQYDAASETWSVVDEG